MSRLSRYLTRITDAASTVGAVALLVISAMVTVDVFKRFFTGRPISGVYELSTAFLVAVTFLPLGSVLARKMQLRVDILLELARGKVHAALGLLDAAVGLIVFGILLSISIDEVFKAYFGRFLQRGLIDIPTWIPESMILIGAALAVLALLLQCIDAIRTLLGYPPQSERNGDSGQAGL